VKAANPVAPGTSKAFGELPGPAFQRALVVAFVALALALGVASAVQTPSRVVLVLAAVLPLPLILMEWRIGVLLLTLVLPAATLLPSLRGLNLLNYLTTATLAAFAVQAAFRRESVVGLPALLWACLALPAAIGMAIAWPHIPEAVRNYPLLEGARQIYDPPRYLMDRFVKPVFYFFSFAFLLANAVQRSARPERFVALVVPALLLPSAAVFWSVANYPGTLVELVGDREFMAARGMHANEFGMQLALAVGPLLFVAGGVKDRGWRALAGLGVALGTLALLMTMSRGALLAWLIALLGFLWHHRRVKTVVGGVFLVALLWLAVPSELQDRFGTGLREGALSDTQRVDRDELTAGRVHGWTLLAPEVLDSPVWGRGLGSTQWSTAVASGQYKANHPHNIILELLMDLGLTGLAAFVVLHMAYLRRLKRLGRDTALHPVLSSYFQGVRWTFFGALAMAMTTAYYMPNPAQAPWWFALGLLFAFWQRGESGSRSQQAAAARESGSRVS
jgi:O-antigen ligase